MTFPSIYPLDHTTRISFQPDFLSP